MNKIIGYRGEISSLKRYETGKQTLIIKPQQKNPCEISLGDDYSDLVNILEQIPEFANTFNVSIEKQVPFHNAEILRIDGIIFGFLSGKYPKANVRYITPQARLSESSAIIKNFPEIEEIKTPKGYTGKKDTKIPGLKIVRFFYPEFYEHISTEMEDDKLDDICDSLVYAITGTSFSPIGFKLNEKLRKKENYKNI